LGLDIVATALLKGGTEYNTLRTVIILKIQVVAKWTKILLEQNCDSEIPLKIKYSKLKTLHCYITVHTTGVTKFRETEFRKYFARFGNYFPKFRDILIRNFATRTKFREILPKFYEI
jgi:hypothetical protein